MYRRKDGKFSQTTSRLSSACGDKPFENDVQKIGSVSKNSLIGGRVVGIEGVCFTLMACTHGYGMGNIYDNRKLV